MRAESLRKTRKEVQSPFFKNAVRIGLDNWKSTPVELGMDVICFIMMWIYINNLFCEVPAPISACIKLKIVTTENKTTVVKTELSAAVSVQFLSR